MKDDVYAMHSGAQAFMVIESASNEFGPQRLELIEARRWSDQAANVPTVGTKPTREVGSHEPAGPGYQAT
jgi:hypothetical protein